MIFRLGYLIRQFTEYRNHSLKPFLEITATHILCSILNIQRVPILWEETFQGLYICMLVVDLISKPISL